MKKEICNHTTKRVKCNKETCDGIIFEHDFHCDKCGLAVPMIKIDKDYLRDLDFKVHIDTSPDPKHEGDDPDVCLACKKEGISKTNNQCQNEECDKIFGVNPTKKHSMDCIVLRDSGKECECDGYHTFTELYTHRHILFITLCKQILNRYIIKYGDDYNGGDIWRSRLHSDGTMFEGWFIMGIYQSQGHQITYHLPIHLWDNTSFAETLSKAPEWDGHKPDDVLIRLLDL